MGKRIVLTSFGSFGDLNPYLGLALGLRARGHRPVIATAPFYRPHVEREGIEFHPVAPDIDPHDGEVVRRIMDPRRGSEFILRELILPHLRRAYHDLADAARGADLLVSHPVTFAAPPLAEARGLPWASTVLAPMSFFSAHDLPVFPPAPRLVAVNRLGTRVTRPLLALVRRATRGWMEPVRALRAELGLAPGGDPLYEGQFSPHRVLALFPRVLARPQPDWPARTLVTGHVPYDGPGAGPRLAPELESFLDDGPPPVVFTLGTSAVGAAGDFYRESAEAARRLGLRAVLLVGRDPRNRPAALPAGVVAAEFAPHSEIFPRAAAVVHQGGAGTTGHALRAGRPMLVVPYAHDQPDNAHRLARLGVARTLYPGRYSARRAAAGLRRLLDDGEYARRAEAVGREVRSEDAVGAACDALEALAG